MRARSPYKTVSIEISDIADFCFENIGTPENEFPSSQVPKFPSSEVSKFPELQVPKFPELQVPKFPELQVSKFPGLQVPGISNNIIC